MKILKLMAAVAIVGYGSSMLAMEVTAVANIEKFLGPEGASEVLSLDVNTLNTLYAEVEELYRKKKEVRHNYNSEQRVRDDLNDTLILLSARRFGETKDLNFLRNQIRMYKEGLQFLENDPAVIERTIISNKNVTKIFEHFLQKRFQEG